MTATPARLRWPRIAATLAIALLVEVGLGWRLGVCPALPAYLYLGGVGVAPPAIDAATRRLPDRIVLPSYPILGAALMGASAADARWAALARAGLAMLALGGGYLALGLAQPTGLGGGDVKLAGLLGLALGWLAWAAVLTATLTGFLLAAVVLLAHRLPRRAPTVDRALPFGPYMLTGAFIAILTTAGS